MPHPEPGPPLLCSGVSWPAQAGTPWLSLRDSENQRHDIDLESGVRLGFKVLPGRWCLGHQLVHDRTRRTHVPCPDGNRIQHGTKCESCAAADQTRAMHDFHRSGRAGAGLRDYLMQEHWLYVASFAHGASKVGTAANPSKWRRLAEQGAISAAYVGWAADGAQIRLLEDTLTRELGLAQQVRAQAKVRGLLESSTGTADLAALTARNAAAARELVSGLPGAGEQTFTAVAEDWEPPAQAAGLLAGWNSNGLQPYPGDLTEAEHGFVLHAVLGQVLGVHLGDGNDMFVVDAARLKGRKLVLGEYLTPAPAVQAALF